MHYENLSKTSQITSDTKSNETKAKIRQIRPPCPPNSPFRRRVGLGISTNRLIISDPNRRKTRAKSKRIIWLSKIKANNFIIKIEFDYLKDFKVYSTQSKVIRMLHKTKLKVRIVKCSMTIIHFTFCTYIYTCIYVLYKNTLNTCQLLCILYIHI